MTAVTHNERQFLQHLRGAGWVKAISLPNSSKLIQTLLDRGWIERRDGEGGVSYRITDEGLAAKKAPVRL